MAEQMNAVAITGQRDVRVIQMERPDPKPNEIQIRVRVCALCTWKQRVFAGEKKMPLPLVGGHEFAGEISALGADVDPKQYPLGTRVVARILKACNSCYYCRRGEPTQCVELNTFKLNGPVYGLGGLAEYICLERSAVPVYGLGGLAEYICLERSAVWCFGEERPFSEMALTEPLACVLHSIRRAQPKFGDDAVVIGGGVMGQLHLLCLQKMGIRTILSEPDADRRAFALAHGCHVAIDPAREDAIARVLQLTGGRDAESVFNTTVIPQVEEDAIRMTGKLGRCIAFSSQHPDQPVPVSPNWLHNSEAILTGAVNPSVASFDQAVNIISKNMVDISDLVSGVYPKEEAQQAFLEAMNPQTYRVEISL